MNTQNTVMVVGSSGFLGRCVTNLLGSRVNVVPTHCKTLHFPNSIGYDFFKDDIGESLERLDVFVVIFTAAVETGPPTDVQASIQTSIRISMERLARACKSRRLVYLSSDGVFDGNRGLYSEADIPTPRTPYGRNLLLCEQLVAEICPNFCIIRPSYIYGFSNGQLDKRLAQTRKALEAGEDVILFDDMYKSPLGVKQVAEAVISLSFSDYVGIVHVAGQRLSVFEFHQQAMEALGVETSHLRPRSMPAGGAFLRDTSLRSLLWQRLTGGKPLSVKESLSN